MKAPADASAALVDHRGLDWATVVASTFLLHERLRYEYSSPAHRLRHRLMVVPPANHGDQRRILHHVDVTGAPANVVEHLDDFGNHVVEVRAPLVGAFIDFEVTVVVERGAARGPTQVGAEAQELSRLVEPTALTRPDAALAAAASRLLASGDTGRALALRINRWVHGSLGYRHDVTHVGTSAAAALAIGQGVCQDYAHVMLAVARLCGLPARYVSGHLLGEGGSHAWVEVLIAGDPVQPVVALPLDPTHGREVGLSYLTVAVGRDYADVAPTSGTYRSDCPGNLSVRKRLGLKRIELSTP